MDSSEYDYEINYGNYNVLDQTIDNFYQNDTQERHINNCSVNSLPSKFFEKICDIENSLLLEKDLIKIENLARLYKIGVEYYSGVNSVKENDFLFRLQALFSDKNLFNYQPNQNNDEKTKIDRRKTKYNMEINLINKLKENDSAATLLSKFEIGFNNALNIIQKGIYEQELNLTNMIKKKKREMSLLAEINLTPNSRKSISFIPDNSGTLRKSLQTPKDKIKINFNNTNRRNSKKDNMDSTEIDHAMNLQNRKKRVRQSKVNEKYAIMIANLNNILEIFQNEYINIFCSLSFSKLSNELIEECNSFYRKSVDNFTGFEDQIKELEMMMDGNENNEYNNTLALMIENLMKEKKNNEFNLKLEYDEKIKNLINKFSMDCNIEDSEYFKNLLALMRSKFLDLLVSNDLSITN